MNAAPKNYKHEFYQNNMGQPVFWSFLFHVLVFALAVTGLPYLSAPPEAEEIPITVELANLSELSQTPKIDKPQKEEEVKEKPPAPPERKPVYNKSNIMPGELTEPEAPDIDIPEPPKNKPEKKIAIKNPPKPKNKPRKPKATSIEKKEEKPQKETEQKDFSSLLRSLTPDQPEDVKPEPPPEEKKEETTPQPAQIADFSKDLTRSEMETLNSGVSPCWNLQAGGKYAEKLKVTLRVFIDQNMKVSQVQILDQIRYNSDTHFRAAADAARRALLNPRCSTLRLPKEKYEDWKVFRYHFDPSHML